DAQNLERTDDSVAGSGEITENDMTALLAAEIQFPPHHFFDDIAIAHFRADHFSAMCGKRFIETKIAHDRGHDRVLLKPAAQKIDSCDGENLITIDNLSIFVAKQDAISVAIMRDADICVGFPYES